MTSSESTSESHNVSIDEETSVEELEKEIDDAVYDLFDLTDDEREVIEDYLEVF